MNNSVSLSFETVDRDDNDQAPYIRKKIAVAQPDLFGNELEYVSDCLRSTWISSSGKYIEQFEDVFAKFCGTRHAIVTNNGTTALHLALVALGVGPGDEVIVPTLTYVATANAVRYCGATPVFADSDPATMTIDPVSAAARISDRTKAILPVHLYGHPANMAEIKDLAVRHGLTIVEDAAEAHGALCDGNRVGGIGDCGVFSFFGNKIITTGEGGAVTTNDDDLAARLRLYRGQGMDPDRRYWFPVVGYNYRMTNVAAAIGVAQMERVEQNLAARKQLAKWYTDRLADHTDLFDLPRTAPWASHVFWMYTVVLREAAAAQRDQVMQKMASEQIETRPVFYPMHILPPYKDEYGRYPVAERLGARGLNLPTHCSLTESDVDRIVSELVAAVSSSQ